MKKYLIRTKQGQQHIINAKSLTDAFKKAIWITGAGNYTDDLPCNISLIKTIKA